MRRIAIAVGLAAILCQSQAVARGGGASLGGFAQGASDAERDEQERLLREQEIEMRRLQIERMRQGEPAPPLYQPQPSMPRCRIETYQINGILTRCKVCGSASVCEQAN